MVIGCGMIGLGAIVRASIGGAKVIAIDKSVELVGHGKVKFTRDAEGLKVSLPSSAAKSVAPVLRIRK